MRSLRVGPQCLGHCSSSVAAAEDRGVLTQQRWDAHGCLRPSLAAVWFLTPNTCMCGAARAPCVKGLEHRALFDRGKPERKLCAYWVQTHSAGMGAHLFIYLFLNLCLLARLQYSYDSPTRHATWVHTGAGRTWALTVNDNMVYTCHFPFTYSPLDHALVAPDACTGSPIAVDRLNPLWGKSALS